MVITGICPVGRNRFRIFIDEEFAFFLYASELRQIGLGEGQPVSEELVDHILTKYVHKRALSKAMDLLKRQDYSVSELTRRLQRAEFPDAIVRTVVAELCSRGYLDDVRYAGQYIYEAALRMGRRRIEYQLKAKGISREDIAKAYERYAQDADETLQQEDETLRRLLRQKLNGRQLQELERKEKNRIFQFLARRGFSQERIYSAMRELAELETDRDCL